MTIFLLGVAIGFGLGAASAIWLSINIGARY